MSTREPRRAACAGAAALALLTISCSGAAGPAEAAGVKPTMHAIGDCRAAADRPVCLLKVLAAAPHHFPYRNRTEFAGASPALLVEIEGEVTTAEAELKDGPRDALDQYEAIPLLRKQEAIRAALEADRAGRSPEEALTPIRELGQGLKSRSFLLGQIVTAGGAQLRASAYHAVWGAYRDPDVPPDKRPSLPLAKAALDAWAETARGEADSGNWYLPGLVEAYGSLGDEAAARREAARLDEPPAAARLRLLAALSRLEEATAAAEALKPGDFPQNDHGSAFDSTLRRLALTVLKAGRTDLALRISRARLAAALATGERAEYLASFGVEREDAPLALVQAEAGDREVREWAAKFEAVARSGRDARSLAAAQWATEAWVRAGAPERGRALLDHYRPLAEPDMMACNDQPVCYRRGLEQMALWVGDYDTAAKMYGNVPFDLVNFDVDQGRGLANLDAHLARTDNPAWADQALNECAERAARRRNWAVAKGCVERLVARIDRPLAPHEVRLREITTDGGRPRVTAVTAAMAVADNAARFKELAVAREMTDVALTLARGGEDAELPSPVRWGIERVAVAELRAAGRL